MHKIFQSDTITKRELGGATVIGGLLDIFGEVVMDLSNVNFEIPKLKGKSERLARLIGNSLQRANSTYDALLYLTDFVSGMTDRFSVDTYRTLKGIST